MMRTLFYLFAAFLLTGLGAGVALLATPDKLTLILEAGGEEAREAPPPPPPDRTDEVLAEVGSLRRALAAFGRALDDSATRQDALAAGFAAERRDTAEAQSALEQSLGRLEQQGRQARARLDALAAAINRRAAVKVQPAKKPAGPPEAKPKTMPVPAPKPVPPEVRKRKSLAALLAERSRTDVRDKPTDWKLVTGHCRVGFDGVSTIHNFTARSNAVAGSFRLQFRDLSQGASGRVGLRVATLVSGNDDRDGEIRKQLAGERQEAPVIACEILSITAAPAGRKGDTIRAIARVRFSIHGKTRELEAPLTLSFTAQRLLHVKGELALKLSDFDIFPKAKMGLIKVEDRVTVWWDLYAQVDRGTQG